MKTANITGITGEDSANLSALLFFKDYKVCGVIGEPTPSTSAVLKNRIY